jgi:RNA-directed DNA polymerase
MLANIALGGLDEHLAGRQTTTRAQRRRGQPSIRLIRYADDWVVLVRGTRAHAETLWDKTARALAPMGLPLSAAKTRICHIDEGFDFLGFRIQRQPKKHHPGQRAVYTWPSKKALAAVKAKVRALTRAGSNQPLAALLGHLNRVLRGWTAYFCYGVSKRTFDYLGQFTWNRVLRWLRRKHPKASWGWLRRRYLPRWWPTHGKTALLRCGQVTVSRYRYRGAQIPTPWTATG